MAQSSPQRRRYLAARRRGLSQTEAMKEVGVSRSSAWRYDQLFNQEMADRTAALERFNAPRATRRDAHRDTRANDDEAHAPQEPATYPVPSWDGPSAQESHDEVVLDKVLLDGSFPAGLLERHQRAQGVQGAPPLPVQHPMLNRRAITVLHGSMSEPQNMSGTLSRPWLPEDPPNFLGGVV